MRRRIVTRRMKFMAATVLTLGMISITGFCLAFHSPGLYAQPTYRSASSADKNSAQARTSAKATTKISAQTKSVANAKRSFNSVRAFLYTKEVVAFGPRPVGSAAHKHVEAYIHARLKGDDVADDVFTGNTPVGSFEMRNIIAKYPGTKDGIIVIASHYDTNYPFKNYVGANDGGSTTALLLELANQLRGKREGYSVWLVWFDGEEAFKDWTDTDSVYGSRHLAARWQADGTLQKIKGFLLADMLGDADLNIDRDRDSTEWLEDLVAKAASNTGNQSYFFGRTIDVEDDHIPFMRDGIPCADLIDFTYGPNNSYWHTSQDTVDKLSAKSLLVSGQVILETVHLLDQR